MVRFVAMSTGVVLVLTTFLLTVPANGEPIDADTVPKRRVT